ncbi:pantoate--beta-alanine ligase [Microbacterium sp. NEAU-LLC]|uniref:Pantothenate synthetase n=1 Tax=Microbacterium helvum TaxID=2773713 RepID=A0ABR8NRJ8_9MICO|nr:pantoate--beta-alanine ligase [Microbacterium helvum]MBD3943265.1 pantoate--beta-alanine ligase [Microbacterium helvum]
MIVVRTVSDLRAALRPLRTGTVGLVPTMGALHEGHATLLRAARAADATVVMSLFVNPTQFDEQSDLAAYPRTEPGDLALAEAAGVDIVFAPDAAEMYPRGFVTTVSVSGIVAETLEGAERGRSHFDGVATVVTKLLLAALPDHAYFGAKDAQQVAVIRRLVADLGIPVELVVCPTSRDADGLARSSRNTRLSPDERARAVAIPATLEAIRLAVQRLRAPDGEPPGIPGVLGDDPFGALESWAVAGLETAGIHPEYVAFVDPVTFAAVHDVTQPVLVAIAARVGATRLIDNIVLGGA